jgi:chemotaxis protein MotB
MRVLGLASTQNLNKADPLDPENRRISIIVLNKKSEDALMHDDTTATTLSDNAASAGPLVGKIAPGAAPSMSTAKPTAAAVNVTAPAAAK